MAEPLTAQEQAIKEGKSTWVETSAGFNRLLDEIRSLPIRLLVVRTKIFRPSHDVSFGPIPE